MLKKILGVIGAIAIVIFTYYLNLEKADIRYTLSDEIPVKFFKNEAAENIQQIEIKNIGNDIAEKIIVRIQSNVEEYDISKYSEHDTEVVHRTESLFELIYPELPPQGKFKLIIKSIGRGIQKNDLEIQHRKGLAQEALTSKDIPFVKRQAFFPSNDNYYSRNDFCEKSACLL